MSAGTSHGSGAVDEDGATAIDPTVLRGKRMLVVEEALKNESGHWYEYVKSVAELNRMAGAETAVVSHVETDPAIRREIGAHAIFPWTSWDNVYRYPQAWRRYLGIVHHNLRVYRVMSRFVKQHGPFDILFAPTVTIHHVIGWRLLMARHGGRRIGQIILLFRNNAGSYADDSKTPVFKRSTDILKWALQSFRPLLARGRARFATDSRKLAFEYKHLCGIEPDVFPSPRIAPSAPPAPPAPPVRVPGAPVIFSCLGPARFEKGIDVMQAAIRLYLERHPEGRARFVIQWNDPILDVVGAIYPPDPALRADPRVELIEQTMSSAAYDAAVARTDCMLLPYRRASYFARISGVAVEAVTAGVPVIYTRDTWNEDLVLDLGAGIGVADNDVSGLADAIAKMVEEFDRFSAEAVARADAARRSHSPMAFVAKAWGLA
jgi:glycosyltransferase involved in cell wall biosynthesis